MVEEDQSFPRGRKREKDRAMLRQLVLGAVAVMGLMAAASTEARADTFTAWAYSPDYSSYGYFPISNPSSSGSCLNTIEGAVTYLQVAGFDVFYFYITEQNSAGHYVHFWQVYAPGGWHVIQYF
jgi:hypothetical protein